MSAARGRVTDGPDPELERLLERLNDASLVTAAVAVVGDARGIRRHASVGRTRRVGGRAVRPGDRFDLASLTKPFTASLALSLDQRGLLPLETRIGEIWGAKAAPRLADRTLESLLRHRSGMRSWSPLYRRARTADGALRHLLSEEILATRRERYGDPDYILWALAAEHALGRPLEELFGRYLLRPLGLGGVGPQPGDRATVVECRLGNEREVELAAVQGVPVRVIPGPGVGAVQDGNARFLGGLAGHAGLFGSALDLWRLANEWLAPGPALSARSVERALTGGRRFTLGWTRRTLHGSGGPALGPESFGQIGFTGGSLWIEPRRGAIMILLAHRTSVDSDLGPWRRRFHRLVLG